MSANWSIDELQNVWYLATRQHDGQKYGGQEEGREVEYLNHIGSVTFEILAALNQDASLDADLAIKCAVLHDTLEDTNLTFLEIENRFGKEVAAGVLALTKNDELGDKRTKMLDSLRRIKLQSKSVWAVKMADRICNLYAPPFYWNDERKRAYIEEAKLIHSELQQGSRYLADRLLRKIENYARFFEA